MNSGINKIYENALFSFSLRQYHDYDNFPMKFICNKSTKNSHIFIPGDYYSSKPLRVFL